MDCPASSPSAFRRLFFASRASRFPTTPHDTSAWAASRRVLSFTGGEANSGQRGKRSPQRQSRQKNDLEYYAVGVSFVTVSPLSPSLVPLPTFRLWGGVVT